MFKWFRERHRQYKFTKAFKQAAIVAVNSGEIDAEQYAKCLKAARSTKAMRQAYNQLLADPNMLGGLADWDWDAIYAWIVDHFLPAMRVIIPIIMLLEPNEHE